MSSVEKNSSKTAAFNQMHELAGIEVLRFLCAFAILIWHYPHFFFVGRYNAAQAHAIRPTLPFYWILHHLYERGSSAVLVFWAISGFIFYWRYAQAICDRRVGIVEFATRRFSRLYPLHIVTLILVALLQYVYFRSHGQNFIFQDNSARAFFAQLFLVSKWFEWQAFSFNGPIWSISIEILIYFAFFWIVRAMGAAPLVAIAAGGFGWLLFSSNFSNYFFNEYVFACAVLFFAGGLTQWLSKKRWALALSVFACALTLALLELHTLTLSFTTVVILAVCFVLGFARLGEMRWASVLKHVAFLGNATYSSYLLHFPIQLGMVTVLDAMGYSRIVFLSPITLVVYLALVTGISLATYHLFESPAQNWIRSHTPSTVLSRLALVRRS